MYRLKFTADFSKKAEQWLKKHPNLKDKFYNCLRLLELNPSHNSLRLHKLQGNLKDFYSVSVDMKYRIIIEIYIQDDVIIPLDVGDHSVYSQN